MKHENSQSDNILNRSVGEIKNKLPPVFYGWWIMTAGVIINAVGTGVYNSSSTIFFLPITYSLKISRSATTLIFAVARIQIAVTGPLIGYLLDRYGPRVMVFVGALVMGLGYMLLYGTENYTYLIFIFAGVITLGNNLAFTHSVMTTVNNWFVRRRALALAIAGTAFGIGGTVIAPVLGYSVHIWGWRTTSVLAGILVMVFAMPASFFLRRSPESMGLLPDGLQPKNQTSSTDATSNSMFTDEPNYSIAEWLRSPVFWAIMFSITLRMAVNWTITLHFVPIMVWKGIKEHEAAVLFGVVGFLNIPARLLLGVAGDRYSKPLLLVTCLALGTASLFYLLYWSSSDYIWGFTLMYAIPDATGTLNWAMIGDIVGRKQFAKIRGILSFFFGWGSIGLAVLAGIIFDRTESYSIVLWCCGVIWALAALGFLLLERGFHPGNHRKR